MRHLHLFLRWHFHHQHGYHNARALPDSIIKSNKSVEPGVSLKAPETKPCPCPKTNCKMHGDCDACREKCKVPYCEKKFQYILN